MYERENKKIIILTPTDNVQKGWRRNIYDENKGLEQCTGDIYTNIFNEDTYLRYEQELRYGELSYFSSEQSIFREMPEGIRLNIIQFIRYGQSDMVIAENNLKIFFDLLYHSLIRISIIRSIKLMLKGRFKYIFFTIIMGLFRGFSLLYYKIKK